MDAKEALAQFNHWVMMGFSKSETPNTESIIFAVSVLEKSIPTTPIYVVDDEPLCPYCREPIEYSDCNCDCGQKIAWR